MRRALLVGIDDYPNAPLAGCVNDARALEALLRHHEDGSPNFDTLLLTSADGEIRRADLRRSLDELFRQEADLALFYFSGHGTENNLDGYLITPDSETYDEGVAMADVLTLATKSPVREIVIMVDCCHSGALGNPPAIDNTKALLREGISILTASRSSEPAMEAENDRGVFTTLVCGALDGGAADVLGHVTAASIYTYVDQSLGAWEQRPLFKAHVSRLTSLRKCQGVDPAMLRRFPEWFPTPTAEFRLDPSFEPTVEPHDAVNERIFHDLQKCRDKKLLEPVGEEHMYYAAMNSRSCRLTPLGRHYRRLANDGRI